MHETFILYCRNMLTTSHNMEFKIVPLLCLRHFTHYKKIFYCLLILFIDVENWHLVQFIHEKVACSSHLQLKTLENAPLQNLIVLGHTHGLEKA